jgi:hypothetical protein
LVVLLVVVAHGGRYPFVIDSYIHIIRQFIYRRCVVL